MLQVWTDNATAGVLDRFGQRLQGSTFAYAPQCPQDRAVSLTMPVRVASYDQAVGLLPIFEMNLPEGILRERIRLTFAKAAGTFDDFDVLSLVGRSQIGRIRFSAAGQPLDDAVPFQSVDETLARRRDGELFHYLLDRFAAFSGLSGVQPKVMIRDEEDAWSDRPEGHRRSPSFSSATHIVKFWVPDEFPELAANEFFCLRAAEIMGLDVPRYRLAEDGSALVVDRFDLRDDGSWRGVEDFCVLNARPTSRKYDGGYERSVFRRLKDYIGDDHAAWRDDASRLFGLFVLNVAIRNGDAHLKNFAVIYDQLEDTPRLAPVYDLVTTTAYLPRDRLALTLDGSQLWPTARKLILLGTSRCDLAPREVVETFERTADALSVARAEMLRYAKERPAFRPIAERMSQAWREGIRDSLELTGRTGS